MSLQPTPTEPTPSLLAHSLRESEEGPALRAAAAPSKPEPPPNILFYKPAALEHPASGRVRHDAPLRYEPRQPLAYGLSLRTERRHPSPTTPGPDQRPNQLCRLAAITSTMTAACCAAPYCRRPRQTQAIGFAVSTEDCSTWNTAHRRAKGVGEGGRPYTSRRPAIVDRRQGRQLRLAAPPGVPRGTLLRGRQVLRRQTGRQLKWADCSGAGGFIRR